MKASWFALGVVVVELSWFMRVESKISRFSRRWLLGLLMMTEKDFMIQKLCLKIFKGHKGGPGGEVEEGDKGGVVGVEASKSIGDEVFFFY
jgi:hypothetical protein